MVSSTHASEAPARPAEAQHSHATQEVGRSATPGRCRLYLHSERQRLVNVLYELRLVGGVLRAGETRGVSARAGA